MLKKVIFGSSSIASLFHKFVSKLSPIQYCVCCVLFPRQEHRLMMRRVVQLRPMLLSPTKFNSVFESHTSESSAKILLKFRALSSIVPSTLRLFFHANQLTR